MGPPTDLGDPDPSRPWSAPDAAPGPAPVPTVPGLGPTTAAPGVDDAVRPPIPLRPMTVGAQLDGGYDVVRARPRDVLLLTAVFVIPLQLLVAFLNRDALRDGGSLLAEVLWRLGSDTGGVGWVLGFAALALAYTLAAAAITVTVIGWYAGRRPTPGDALRAVLDRGLALVMLWALVLLSVAVGLLGLVLGAVVVMALLSPAVPALMVEGLGPVDAVRRSVRLARPRIGYVVGVGVLSAVLAWLIGRALGVVPQLLGLALGPERGWVLLGVGSIIADVVWLTVTAATAVLVYLDLRVRQEGLDLAWAADRHLPT